MTLTPRDKRVLLFGGIASAAILLVAYVIVPVAREWRRLGDVLTPRMASLDRLETLAQRQKLLRERRDALAARAGLVAGPEALPKPAPDAPPPGPAGRGADTGPKANTPPPSSSAPAPDSAPLAAPAPAIAQADTAPPSRGPEPSPKSKERAAKAKPSGPEANDGPVSLATHVDRTAKKSGIALTRLTPLRTRAARGERFYVPASVRISFQADLQSLLKFLHELDGNERLIHVEEAEFLRDAKSGPMLQVTMEISGYEVKS